MKLQIKTLNQKCHVVEMDETKTVYELKKELSLYPDIGVKPELQKLIYAGKILNNEEKISSYNIDVKKFLVIMILKQPLPESPVVSTPPKEEKTEEKLAKETVSEEEFKTPPPPPAATTSAVAATNKPETDELVNQIVAMGYVEHDVRRALRASFNNPERAIEYLIEGIPTSPSTPEGDSYTDTDADLSMTPFEMFRGDPVFRNLRNALHNPDLMDAAIQRIGETNPGLLELISEHQQEFLSMLIDGSDEEDDDDNEELS